jgi:hypothetical protein
VEVEGGSSVDSGNFGDMAADCAGNLTEARPRVFVHHAQETVVGSAVKADLSMRVAGLRETVGDLLASAPPGLVPHACGFG